MAAYESRTRQVGDYLGKLPLFVAHDHDHALCKRSDIVSSGAAIHVTGFAGIILHESCIDVAEAIDFQCTQEPDIHNTAMNVHSHDIEKATPASCPIPDTGVGQTDGGIDRLHVHDADLQKSAQPGRVCPLREDARHLRQSKANDNDFTVAQLSGSGNCHDFRRNYFRHFLLSSTIGLKIEGASLSEVEGNLQ